MDFIDKEDDIALRFHHLIHHALEPFLEFPLVLGTRYQRAHIQREYPLLLQILGYVAVHYPVGYPLGYGGFPNAGLAYEYGIVLGTPAQDLQHAPNLLVAPDHRVELSALGLRVQIDREPAERVVRILGALAVHLSALPQLANGQLQLLLTDARILQHLPHSARGCKQCQEERLGRNEFIAHLLREPLCLGQHLVGS